MLKGKKGKAMDILLAIVSTMFVFAVFLLVFVTAFNNHDFEEVNDGLPVHVHSYTEEVIDGGSCNQKEKKKYTCSCSKSYIKEVDLTSYSVNEIREKAKMTVGEIVAYDKKGKALSSGTGFVYSSDGKIITNYHVIENAYSAKILLNGIIYECNSVLGYDKAIDLAVLKVSESNLPLLRICSQEHEVGKIVYAFGKNLTATQGTMDYGDKKIDGVNYVQHNAEITNENSGGPLINEYAEIIGINVNTVLGSKNLNLSISVVELSQLSCENPLTFVEFYKKECDAFLKLKNYIIENGTFDSSNKNYELKFEGNYLPDDTSKCVRYLKYDVTSDELMLELSTNTDCVITIYIDSIAEAYQYSFTNKSQDYIIGRVYASTYTKNTTLSSVNSNISSDSLKDSRKIASSRLNQLLAYFSNDFSSIGVTIQDLGFLSW